MYEAQFGLAELPFHIAPDPRFYVDSPPHHAALGALCKGVEDGEEFLLLGGDFGVGKTSVARRFLDDLDGARYYAGCLSGQRIEGDDLLASIASALGVHEFESVHPLASLIRGLEGRGAAGREAVLVLDEAHRLSTESLRRLRKLTAVHADKRPALHVVLVCRTPPAGIDELRRLGRPLRMGTSVVVQPLDKPGTRDYLRSRLERAGWQGAPLFDDDAASEIHDRCEGNPGRINRLCGHVLLQLYMQGRTEVSADLVRSVDSQLRSELDDEPAPAVPWPAAPSATPVSDEAAPAPSPTFEAVAAQVDVLAYSPGVEQIRVLDAPATSLAGAESGGPPTMPRPRHLVLQGVAAIALFLSGGLTWQVLSSHIAGGAELNLPKEPTAASAPLAPAATGGAPAVVHDAAMAPPATPAAHARPVQTGAAAGS